MAHAQKPDFVFRRNGRVPSNRRGGGSVHSATGSRGVRISGSNAGYTMIRGSVKGTGYSLHSPVSPPLPLPSVTVRHHISTGLYCYVIVQCFILLIRGRAHLNAAGLSVTDVRKQKFVIGEGVTFRLCIELIYV
jgi:hypothetical protein